MILSDIFVGSGFRLPLDAQLDAGGGGAVFGIIGEPHLAAKLHLDAVRAPDLAGHFRTPAEAWVGRRGSPRLAWPITPAKDPDGRTIGFLMLRLIDDDWRVVDACLSSADRRVSGFAFDWGQLVGVARRLAELVVDVHRAGLVVADLSALNLMVSRAGDVAMVDCDDMFAMSDRRPDARRPLLTPKYSAPELLRSDKLAPSSTTDAWSLAILICQLLLDGSHPFEGGTTRRFSAGDVGVDANVRNGRTRFGRSRRFGPPEPRFDVAPVPLDVLPPRVRELATKCFYEHLRAPTDRPRPIEWVEALEGVELARCARRSTHAHSTHLAACPWCAHDREVFPEASLA